MQVVTLSVLSLAGFVLGALWMQEAKTERFTHPVSKDADGGMARWMQTLQPSAAHKRLGEVLGTYDVTMKMYMAPDAPPMESKGTAEISWFAEGKWLQENWSIEMMGQKVKGIGHLGYDNFKERYVWSKIDSMQTCMNTAFGHFDKSGDNLILWGTIDEPMTPEQDKQVKYVTRGFGQDKFTLEVHDMMIGESNTKMLEFVYARKKK
jgi:hypothetical protein